MVIVSPRTPPPARVIFGLIGRGGTRKIIRKEKTAWKWDETLILGAFFIKMTPPRPDLGAKVGQKMEKNPGSKKQNARKGIKTNR